MLPRWELEQLGLQLLLYSGLLLFQVHRRQSDVSPVRVHDQTRVRRWQQRGGGGEGRDRARDHVRDPARYEGRFSRLGMGSSFRDFTRHFHMFWVVFNMLEVRHAAWQDRKTNNRRLPLWGRRNVYQTLENICLSCRLLVRRRYYSRRSYFLLTEKSVFLHNKYFNIFYPLFRK